MAHSQGIGGYAAALGLYRLFRYLPEPFPLAWLRAGNLQHWISFNGIILKCHIKNAIQNIIQLDTG